VPLEPETIKTVDDYVTKHIADPTWHRNFFGFLSDPNLADRLSDEFMSARYIYKLLEGLEAVGWLQRAEVRVQLLLYASIYEAVLHHVLFVDLTNMHEVVELTKQPRLKPYSIPADSLARLSAELNHDRKEIVPAYNSTAVIPLTQVRFDRKVRCARALGIVDEDLSGDLIAIYDARNAIHIHAEIRKGVEYELELSKMAYQRMQPFKRQVSEWLASNSDRIGVYSDGACPAQIGE
jgi:hypothetical protein